MSTFGVIDKAVAAIAAIAVKGRDASRPILSGVRLVNGRAFATDGFVAMAVDLPDSSPDLAATIPAAEIVDVMKRAKPLKIDTLTVNAPDSRSNETTVCIDGDICYAATPFGDWTYPDVQSIIGAGNAQLAMVYFDVDRMRAVLDAISKAGPNKGAVRMWIGHTGEPIVLRADFGETGDRKIDAVVMPMVLE